MLSCMSVVNTNIHQPCKNENTREIKNKIEDYILKGIKRIRWKDIVLSSAWGFQKGTKEQVACKGFGETKR